MNKAVVMRGLEEWWKTLATTAIAILVTLLTVILGHDGVTKSELDSTVRTQTTSIQQQADRNTKHVDGLIDKVELLLQGQAVMQNDSNNTRERLQELNERLKELNERLKTR